MILVRPADAADVEAMSEVLVASITRLCAADHRNDPVILERWLHNKTPAMVESMLANPDARFFVAVRDDEVAAVGCINGTNEIALNYVSPRHRLSGVSKALLAEMERQLRAAGVTTARLTSTGTARRFYLAAGWREQGSPDNDGGMLCYPMVKQL